ncbi:MAG: hypothetical protein AAGA56_16235 [Myxococcota bacterium]
MRAPFVRTVVAVAALAAAVPLANCSDNDEVSPHAAEALFVVPSSLDALAGEQWLDHPWPSDLRTDDGRPVFQGFYNPRGLGLVDTYIAATDRTLDGFSPVAPGYLRFSAPLRVSSLPADPAASLEPTASVQLIDIDETSPSAGERNPILVSFKAERGAFVLENTLQFMPAPGFPLRPATRYALLVTDAVESADGTPVRASSELARALAGSGIAGPLYGAAAASLGQVGVPSDRIVHLTVFTTSQPTRIAEVLAEHVRSSGAVEPPTFRPGVEANNLGATVEYRGTYGPSPNYQHGTIPYRAPADGGGFEFDAAGTPIVANTFDLRFSLTVPNRETCPMPEAGFPIVLFAHGTGGNWRSYVGDFDDALTRRCLAVMGVDQIFHGARPGAPPPDDRLGEGLLFFNYENVVAARANPIQSAVDEVQRARLFTASRAFIPADVSHTGEPIRFDPDKILFLGHSQGGLNGPIFLAIDDSSRGGVFSGAGALIAIALLEKTAPSPSIADLVPTLLFGLSPSERASEWDLFHPGVMLMQSTIDESDVIHYAPEIIVRPREGFRPKSVLLTEGVGPDGTGDTIAPPAGIEAHAVAMGLPLIEPAVLPIPHLDYGARSVTIPSDGLRGNLADGRASGALSQFAPVDGDGHFVAQDIEAANTQIAEFLAALAADPVGRVPPP